MAAEKRGIYFGRMLNLLVSTFRPRTERDFPSNNPQPIEITAFLRRIYFGRACHKRPEIARFQDVFFVFDLKIYCTKRRVLCLTQAVTQTRIRKAPAGQFSTSGWFFTLFYHFFVEHGSNFLSSFRGFSYLLATLRTPPMVLAASFCAEVVTWA